MRLLLCLVLSLSVGDLFAQTDTTFTYQGELKQSGQPANGNYNLTFSLWNALASGAQVGSDIVVNSVSVSEGNFTVQLDFGAAAFNNSNRWLEIEVNGQALVPRQPVTRSPYSIQTRGIYVASDGKVGIGTTNPAADMEIDGTASPDTGLIVRAPGGATGQVAVSSPGGDTGFIGIANGGNRRDIRFTDEGISLLTNGAPTIPSSINGLIINEDGDVGIGTSIINSRLHVVSDHPSSPALFANTSGFQGTAIYGSAEGESANSEGVFGQTASTNGGAALRGVALGFEGGLNIGVRATTFSPDGYAGYFEGPRNYFEGDVGIGTSDPQYKLDVVGEVRIAGLPSGNTTPLHINSQNRLFKSTSSRRYKENIEPLDLGQASESFLQLQPVSYNYIGSTDPDIGLIAEDVAELVPEMVTLDTQGRPESVKYDKGILYLLEIVRKQQSELAQKDSAIESILQRLERLESNASQATRIADAPDTSISRTVAAGARDTP